VNGGYLYYAGEPGPAFETRGAGLMRGDATAYEIMYSYCVETYPELEKSLKPAMEAYRALRMRRRLKQRISQSRLLSARYQNAGKTATPQDVEHVRALMRQQGLEAFCKQYAGILQQNTADALYTKYLAEFDRFDATANLFAPTK
jgi:hypothetical protein